MALLPRQFKALREMLRAELAALRSTIQEGYAATAHQWMAQNQSEREEQKEINRAVTDFTNQRNQADNAAEANQDRRHGQNLIVQ